MVSLQIVLLLVCIFIAGYFVGLIVHMICYMRWLDDKIKKGYFKYKGKTYIIREQNDRKYL